jgi:hypothetical protein
MAEDKETSTFGTPVEGINKLLDIGLQTFSVQTRPRTPESYTDRMETIARYYEAQGQKVLTPKNRKYLKEIQKDLEYKFHEGTTELKQRFKDILK